MHYHIVIDSAWQYPIGCNTDSAAFIVARGIYDGLRCKHTVTLERSNGERIQNFKAWTVTTNLEG